MMIIIQFKPPFSDYERRGAVVARRAHKIALKGVNSYPKV
jgi:hypothetical protein